MTAAVVLLDLGGRLRRRAAQAAPAFSGAFLLALATLVAALTPAAAARADEPVFTDAYLADPANVALGKELFKQQCARCHGRAAYPGKAPRLRPKRLSPEDIYARITYGYRRMPAWEGLFTDEQRMAITAYLKSRRFSN